MVNLENMKLFLRMDEITVDDALISSMITAADAYIANQTGKVHENGNELWDMAIRMLVAHWYNNREVLGSSTTEIPHSVDAIVKHISLCTLYPTAE